MKKVFKYGTGDEIPQGAVYLSTVVEEQTVTIGDLSTKEVRLVWHYFLVEVKE